VKKFQLSNFRFALWCAIQGVILMSLAYLLSTKFFGQYDFLIIFAFVLVVYPYLFKWPFLQPSNCPPPSSGKSASWGAKVALILIFGLITFCGLVAYVYYPNTIGAFSLSDAIVYPSLLLLMWFISIAAGLYRLNREIRYLP
jgi:hypothetical protein